MRPSGTWPLIDFFNSWGCLIVKIFKPITQFLKIEISEKMKNRMKKIKYIHQEVLTTYKFCLKIPKYKKKLSRFVLYKCPVQDFFTSMICPVQVLSMSRFCLCLNFVLSRFCPIWVLPCLGFVCLGFVLSRFCPVQDMSVQVSSWYHF